MHHSTPEFSLFVGDLPLDCNDEKLQRLFQQKFKSVKRVQIIKHDDGSSRGFGFIRFEDKADFQAALSQEMKIGNTTLRLDMAHTRENRYKNRSRYNSFNSTGNNNHHNHHFNSSSSNNHHHHHQQQHNQHHHQSQQQHSGQHHQNNKSLQSEPSTGVGGHHQQQQQPQQQPHNTQSMISGAGGTNILHHPVGVGSGGSGNIGHHSVHQQQPQQPQQQPHNNQTLVSGSGSSSLHHPVVVSPGGGDNIGHHHPVHQQQHNTQPMVNGSGSNNLHHPVVVSSSGGDSIGHHHHSIHHQQHNTQPLVSGSGGSNNLHHPVVVSSSGASIGHHTVHQQSHHATAAAPVDAGINTMLGVQAPHQGPPLYYYYPSPLYFDQPGGAAAPPSLYHTQPFHPQFFAMPSPAYMPNAHTFNQHQPQPPTASLSDATVINNQQQPHQQQVNLRTRDTTIE